MRGGSGQVTLFFPGPDTHFRHHPGRVRRAVEPARPAAGPFI